MQDYENIFTLLQQDLITWISDNEKTTNSISGKNLKQLFLFKNNVLEIDLTRFNDDYYQRVFAYQKGEKMREAFITKVCLRIKEKLMQIGKYDLKLMLSVKNKFNTCTKTVYIHPKFNEPAVMTSR